MNGIKILAMFLGTFLCGTFAAHASDWYNAETCIAGLCSVYKCEKPVLTSPAEVYQNNLGRGSTIEEKSDGSVVVATHDVDHATWIYFRTQEECRKLADALASARSGLPDELVKEPASNAGAVWDC